MHSDACYSSGVIGHKRGAQRWDAVVGTLTRQQVQPTARQSGTWAVHHAKECVSIHCAVRTWGDAAVAQQRPPQQGGLPLIGHELVGVPPRLHWAAWCNLDCRKQKTTHHRQEGGSLCIDHELVGAPPRLQAQEKRRKPPQNKVDGGGVCGGESLPRWPDQRRAA